MSEHTDKPYIGPGFPCADVYNELADQDARRADLCGVENLRELLAMSESDDYTDGGTIRLGGHDMDRFSTTLAALIEREEAGQEPSEKLLWAVSQAVYGGGDVLSERLEHLRDAYNEFKQQDNQEKP